MGGIAPLKQKKLQWATEAEMDEDRAELLGGA